MTDLRKVIGMELKALDTALWRARVAATHSSGQHIQIGHAIDASHRLYIALRTALAQGEQTPVEPPDYVEPVTFDYHDGWEEGFKAGVEAKTKGTKMTLEEFRDYVVLNAMYETIYTDGEGKSILVITMLDAYALVNKIKEQA